MARINPSLKASLDDLVNALADLEATCMTRSDDPALTALKDDLQRIIEKAKAEVVAPIP